MAKLYRHAVDGTYYTTRYDEGGTVTRRIHPDGVVLLKRRGIRPGQDVPPFAMAELVSGNWLYAEDEVAHLTGVDWSPEWSEIGDAPAPRLRADLHPRGSLPQIDVPLMANSLPALSPARQPGVPMWTGVGLVLLLVLVLYLGTQV